MSATPTLAYIGGLSRSGSTLTELLLASHEGVTTTGELQILPHELAGPARPDLPCGCGARVASCDFWAEVARRTRPLDQPPPRLDHFREHYNYGSTVRPRRFVDATRVGPSATTRAAMRQYAQNTADVVTAVADLTGERTGARPSVVVDASKDPYRAIWLARGGQEAGLDVRIVHLVRDPRGSVRSLTKGIDGTRELLVTAARRAAAWTLENELIHRLGRVHLDDTRYRLVRYEDLVTDVDRVLAELAAFLGVPPIVDAHERHQTVEVHTVAGNPMRWSRRDLALDESWRDELDPRARRIVEAITAPLRRRYGYRT